MKNLIFVGAWLAAASAAFAEQPETPAVTAEQIKKGSGMYAQHCAPCHGPRMADPEGAFDLRKFPPDGYERFVRSVVNGKNSMPPWGGLFKRDEVDALWAYVVEGEKK
jgi:mono/diheme cytochrome c family protein